jgi:anti-sigma B factor antagonist
VRQHLHGDVVVVEINGELTGAEKDALVETIESLLSEGRLKIVLDFTNLTFINSAGIGALVVAAVAAARAGGEIVVTGLSKNHENIFHISRLDEAMPVYPTASEAVVALEK